MVVAQDRFAFLVDEELLEVPPHVAVLKRRVEQARSCRVEDLLSWRAVRLEQKTSYRGRELPQVSFLSRQTFCHDKRMFVATNTCLWRQNTSFLSFLFATKACLPLQYHWRELPQVSFLLRQTFCRDKTHLSCFRFFQRAVSWSEWHHILL